jgi:hypothetical protein
VTTGVRTDEGVESVWDTYLGTASTRTVDYAPDGASVNASGTPSRSVYPKRSELRRAERAGARKGGDRRPASSRPRGQGPQPNHPNHLTYAGYGAPASSPERAPSFGHVIRPTEPRPRTITPRWREFAPEAGPATAAGGLLPKWDDDFPFPVGDPTPPRGIGLPVTPRSAAVLPATGPLPVRPDETPVPDGPGTGAVTRVVNTAAAGLPVTASPDPSTWSLDVDAAPRRSGRRRGEAGPELAPARATKKPRGATKVGTLIPGKGTAGAARLLVLALVVGFEGLAVTSLARTAQTEPEPHEQLGIIPESAAVLAEADGRFQAAVVAQEESQALDVAHDRSGSAKMSAALSQVKAAQDRIREAAERKAAILANARADPRSVAKLMLADRGWGASQFSCLNNLWNRESRWDYTATNPSSGAYGIPQSLPASKMASAGPDYRTNPITQIEWGLDYISDRYGTPCGAWAHSESVGWY